MIQLYDRDAKVVVEVFNRLADLFTAGTGNAEAQQRLWEWSPPEGARGRPADTEYRTDQAARLRFIVAAINDQFGDSVGAKQAG